MSESNGHHSFPNRHETYKDLEKDFEVYCKKRDTERYDTNKENDRICNNGEDHTDKDESIKSNHKPNSSLGLSQSNYSVSEREHHKRPRSSSPSRNNFPVRNDRRIRCIPINKIDPNLPTIDDDPRVDINKGVKYAKVIGGGRNTESFDPKDTLVRPDLRVIVGPNREKYGKPLKHDDIIIVPEFFCKEDDWSIYYKLIEEIRELQSKNIQKSEFISWHEGAHLIVQNPKDSPTFQLLQQKIAAYFEIENVSVGTRFNWYRDSSDFKPFHHDSAAFNPTRARNQNITVGISFGATRELAFLHANNKCKVYFPQTNGMLFSFGRDVNITWKHGVNALPEEEQDGKGRISIVLWGLAPHCIEEKNSPPMLTDNTRGYGHNIHATSSAEYSMNSSEVRHHHRNNHDSVNHRHVTYGQDSRQRSSHPQPYVYSNDHHSYDRGNINRDGVKCGNYHRKGDRNAYSDRNSREYEKHKPRSIGHDDDEFRGRRRDSRHRD